MFSRGNGEACLCRGIGDLGDTIACGGVGKGVVGLSVVAESSMSSERYERSIPEKNIFDFIKCSPLDVQTDNVLYLVQN